MNALAKLYPNSRFAGYEIIYDTAGYHRPKPLVNVAFVQTRSISDLLRCRSGQSRHRREQAAAMSNAKSESDCALVQNID
jgi:hypothetical protein